MKKKKRSLLLLALGLAWLWVSALANVYAADQVVSDCGDNGGANQLRAKIAAAMASGGGTITFSCGPTITLQEGMIMIFGTTITLNGGNGITISGNNASRIFFVTYDSTLTKKGLLTLNNVTLTKGYSGAEDGGAIFIGAGTVNLNNSKLLDNQAGGRGGAIMSYGLLNVTNSEFANNKGASGGALHLTAGSNPVTIKSSLFHDNQTTGTTSDTGRGGAIHIVSGAVVTLENSTLKNNKARSNIGATGGGIYNSATVNLTNVTLTGNVAPEGGGLYNGGTATLINSMLNGNAADRIGGGIANFSGTANLSNVTLNGNTALAGGGMSNNQGTANLTAVTVNDNQASDGGGGIYNVQGTTTLINATISGNSTSGSGGGININQGIVNLTNVTLRGNSAAGWGGGIFRQNGTVTIKNTLLAKGAAGVNCTATTGGTFSLSDDGSCGFGIGRDNVLNLNLGPLGNNGGSTHTHLPGAGSTVIDQAQCTDVNGNPVTKDQRGITRPQGLACDVGAVEVQSAPPTPTRTRTLTPTATKTATRLTPTVTHTPTTGCQSKPAKPNLKKPADNVTLTTARPVLKWSAATCAEMYKVVIKDAATGKKAQKKGGLTALKYKTDPLPSGTYRWFVKACNPPHGCNKSMARTFTVQ